jgi:ATP-dependent DNA ligase I
MQSSVVLLDEIARTSAEVAATSARSRKVELLAGCLRGLTVHEIPIAVAYLSGELPQGSVGVGWAALKTLPPPAPPPPALELLDVDAAVSRIAAASGKGSQAVRRAELMGLLERATEREQRFLASLLLGELRQGALEGVMADAVAGAAGLSAAEVRRASMLAGNLRDVAAAAIGERPSGVARFGLTLLRPVKPMLAQSADSLEDAFDRLGRAAVEWKLDGARLQVHRLGSEVRAFTRSLADVTDRVPEIVSVVLALQSEAIVLDGEAIALKKDGTPHRFQLTMSRFGSRQDNDAATRVPLTALFFDVLHADGEDLLDRPASERFAELDRHVPEASRVPRIVTQDVLEAGRFLAGALDRGHEGVVVKAFDAPYEAGRRGGSWLKVKPTHTLDLVVLAAEWGHGRRRGKLSNLHLGARDPATGEFVMLGKTFKGMTDAMLAWQTERLLELETRSDSFTVYVRPELVVEVAFDGVQTSRRYPGGVALRFARLKGYRPDKGPEEVDTIDAVRTIHSGPSVT